uniref:Reverse transcriptase domain-containing protein n=1 Tax=Callorhinchus milii TaxID=7868 RepID=A0A4W3HD14_CALMI
MPILKKPSLDHSLLPNYRPISNLPFFSKVLERIVASQLCSFLSRHSLLEPLQSGFRATHSTETALVKVTNDILSICDQGSLCLLILFDFFAAFNTVNHSILIHCLSSHLNLHSAVLDWFRFYLSHRLHFISSNGFSSSPQTISCSAPQGSVLGPLLFNIYMLSLGDIIRRHGVNFHMYKDDTQLYLSASILDSRTTAVLTECLSDIKSWMRANFLQLNVNKTKALLMAPVSTMTRSAFRHLCNVAQLHHCLSPQAAETLIHAFITSRLDDVNSQLVGLPNSSLHRLQIIQDSAARVLSC